MSKKNKWTAEKISNQSGKIAVITGANSGIGFEAARVLASKKAKVVMAVRTVKKGKRAADKIREEFSWADIEVMELDLADLSSVEEFANNYKDKFDKLNYLINNAGVMVPPYSKTKNGFELQFGTNHLGHFALVGRLIDTIVNTENSRIVVVSSGAHKFGDINFNDLDWSKRDYKPWRSYGDSKIANLYFAFELQDKLKKAGYDTIVTEAHPGYTATNLQRHNFLSRLFNHFLAQKVETGALPTLRAATDKNVYGGEFFGPDGILEMRGYPERVLSNELSRNRIVSKKLWDVSEKLTGVRFNL